MISKGRRNELKSRAYYLASGLLENIEPSLTGGFDDCDEAEIKVVEHQLQRIADQLAKKAGVE